MRGAIRAGLLALALGAGAADAAPQPDEILEDPAQEARAREVSAELRCLVCRNESIDDSDAELARTLRLLVRERIEAGDTNAEALDYVVDRYGEYVLLKPRFSLANAWIWLAGPLIFIGGGALAYGFLHRRGRAPEAAAAPLSEEESRRLEALLRE